MGSGESIRQHPDYEETHQLMDLMVRTSQWPGDGNTEFVDQVGGYLSNQGWVVQQTQDPEMSNRSLLTVEVGDPKGEQILATISHSDVVGIDGQVWQHDPRQLTEVDETWFGRGVCDTHGSGVAMLLAGNMDEVKEALTQAGKRVSIVFTYDEEATSAELSMRGARLAVGDFGAKAVVDTKYFIAGEPTEIDGKIRAMRSHKGRWLAHFTVTVDHSGHVSDNVQNALTEAIEIVQELKHYGRTLQLGSSQDKEATPYNPPHSTVQVSAADVKSGDFSTTPKTVRFTVDMRTLPDIHDLRALEVADLIRTTLKDPHTHVELEVVKDAPGSITQLDSPIVRAAYDITGGEVLGFNGGDEGRILRLKAGMEGVTVGPGSLQYAHMPNEQIDPRSIWRAKDVYKQLFLRAINLK